MISEQPLVSIVLPTYNRAHFIGQAITSALCQTYENIELIVVDDGSTDDTTRVIGTFSDDRLKYIQLPKNVGRSAARNKALSFATGPYIAFLDSDDYFLPHKTEMQVQFLNEHREFGMVYTASACVVDGGTSINYFYRAPVSGDLYNEIAFFKPLTITLPTVMLRREVLEKVVGFDEKMERFEDTDFWRRVSKTCKIGAINEVTCHIRSHDGNHISAFDPKSYERAIEYYVQKINTEDKDVDPLVVGAGTGRLYELYGSALIGVPGAAELASKLTVKGRTSFLPSVSIIIPVYNGANYLDQAIDSALAQTYRNVEIVVVNDGSNDAGATERIALGYGGRIRYFSKPNGGCASALNRAVQEARGDYISWLSHDDLMAPDKLERQIAFLKQQPNPAKCIVYGDYSVFYGDRARFSSRRAVDMPTVNPSDFRYFLTTYNILHGCSLLIPRRAILRHGLFDETLRTVLDFDLWFRLAKTEQFVYLPGVVVHARAHPDQDTNRKRDVHMKEANALLARFADELSEEEIRRGSGQSLIYGYYLIAENLHRRNFGEAAAHVLAVAERTAADAMGAKGTTKQQQEARQALFDILRTAVTHGALAPKPDVAADSAVPSTNGAVRYEGSAALESGLTSHGFKGRFVKVAQKCVNSRHFGSAVRFVIKSPSLQRAARTLVRRLPASAQAPLATIWRRHR